MFRMLTFAGKYNRNAVLKIWQDSEDPSDTSSYDFKAGEYRPLSNHHKKCNGDVNKVPEDHIVTINVSGTKFQTHESTLRR